MKRNVGGLDRAVRLLVGIFLIALGLGVVRGKGGIVAAIVGLILLITGLKGSCALYVPLGIDAGGQAKPLSLSETPAAVSEGP
jgi:hypothetical protein